MAFLIARASGRPCRAKLWVWHLAPGWLRLVSVGLLYQPIYDIMVILAKYQVFA
ncbi:MULTISPECIES: hypothetical protein [Moorena]|uniref:hypothetical protein n=1 Tax=Moorena TaxID=1155738 RepID=UPI0002D9E80C|nr:MULTISPECIES: hypothetical protein [Moorena]NEQ14366.1 hypothetical protein [Moorena sp. SIO3E2]NEP31402.1 hypothetical protein [Moorena sp. SIO3B2]NEP66490.1 hypothetical protein [Moorena sp. SIO3A5]NEQ08766.1 hypothetical protein [Moorena sp. SIO4E2]NER90170.1 hypothetical protein [Moorena sp. SIO3A2]